MHTACVVYSFTVCEVKLGSKSLIGAKDNGCYEDHTVMESSHIAKQVPNTVFGSLLHPCVAIQVQLDVPLNPIVMMLVLLVNELFRLDWAQEWKILCIKAERVEDVIRELDLMIVKRYDGVPPDMVLESSKLVRTQRLLQWIIRLAKVYKCMTINDSSPWLV